MTVYNMFVIPTDFLIKQNTVHHCNPCIYIFYNIYDAVIIILNGDYCGSIEGHLRDARLEIFNRFPLGDFVVGRRQPIIVLVPNRVGQRQSRTRFQGRHRFQLYAKGVVRIVRIYGGRRRRVFFVDVRGFRFVTGCSRSDAFQRPELGQNEPPGVSALLKHRSAGVTRGRGKTDVFLRVWRRPGLLIRGGGIGQTFLRASMVISLPRRRRLYRRRQRARCLVPSVGVVWWRRRQRQW